MTGTGMRDGFALPVALLAMMVIGAVVTGGFYASSQEHQISLSTDLGSQAFYVAEYGLEEVLGQWTNADLARPAPATPDTVPVTSSGQVLGAYVPSWKQIGDHLFLVTSEGRVEAGGRTAVRTVARVVRRSVGRMPYNSALSVLGGLSAQGNSQILGNDAGGPGCVPGDSVAAVSARDEDLVEQGNKDHIIGAPAIEEHPTMDVARLSDFGAIDLSMLIASASRTYAAGETQTGMAPIVTVDTDGQEICDTGVRSNWGDPAGTGACGNELPIIYAEGDLHLKTGTGQGVLIVEGDLFATGNFDFYGVVVVLGSLFTAGTGNHIEGSVIVQGEGELDSESTTTGNSLVQYSKCRIDRAFNNSLRPRPLDTRSWVDLSAATWIGIT